MSTEIEIATAISIATVIISATQIVVAYLSKSKELEIARLDQERKWKLTASEFLINHMGEIFSKETETRMQMQDILKVAFPTEIGQHLLRQFDNVVLVELLGPMSIQFDRTKRAFDGWWNNHLYREAKILREGNQVIRDLLINKAHLIPSDLMDDAHNLIEHYDSWLAEFDKVRGNEDMSEDTPFVGFPVQGFPFPSYAEKRFVERYKELKQAQKLS